MVLSEYLFSFPLCSSLSLFFSVFPFSQCVLRGQSGLHASESLCQVALRVSARWRQLNGPESQVCNCSFLESWCFCGLRLSFVIYRQISDHQSRNHSKSLWIVSTPWRACLWEWHPGKVWRAQDFGSRIPEAWPELLHSTSFTVFPLLPPLPGPLMAPCRGDISGMTKGQTMLKSWWSLCLWKCVCSCSKVKKMLREINYDHPPAHWMRK